MSTRHSLEVAEHLDSRKMLVMRRPGETNPDELRDMFRPGESLDCFDGEL